MATKRRSGWFKWLLVLVICGGGIAAGVVYATRPKSEAFEFRTNSITRSDITQIVTANGALSPVKNVLVGSQISGIIKEIKVDFNSRVAEGEIIAQIDPATYEQSVSQAEAEVANVEAALELAVLNHKRTKELRADDLIAASEADKTLADLHQAEAVVKIRTAALEKAKVDLARTTIYAPIAGVIISRNVDVGQTVAASFSTPTLFQIANDLAKMQIDAMVSEADVGAVEVGQKVTFNVDAFPTRKFHGLVRQVRYAPMTNQNVVNYTAVVEVNNDDLKLRPGMTAVTSVITAQRPDALKIPNTALRFRPPDAAVMKPSPPATGAATGDAKQTSPTAQPAPSPPAGGGEGARPNPEEMRRRFESMTPEQRAEMRERRGRSGEGGPPGGFRRSSENSRPSEEGPVTRTVYLLVNTTSALGKEIQLAKPVTVKLGISDGTFTEVLEGLKENDIVITGLNSAASMAQAPNPAGSSPFGRPFGGGGGMRPR